MYYHEKKLQWPVRVDTPDPVFARQLQQAIGGIEGEIRVCMQYFFQAWGARGPSSKYRDMLLHTAKFLYYYVDHQVVKLTQAIFFIFTHGY